MFTSTEAAQLLQTIIGLDNMLAAYMTEYGEDLAKALTEETVEAEIIEEDDEQETSETGFDSEDAGLDASEEE